MTFFIIFSLTFFVFYPHSQLPGKKASGQSGWAIQAKLQVYLWLGLTKHKKDFLNGLPKGYEENADILNACKPNAFPPLTITYVGKCIQGDTPQSCIRKI